MEENEFKKKEGKNETNYSCYWYGMCRALIFIEIDEKIGFNKNLIVRSVNLIICVMMTYEETDAVNLLLCESTLLF